MLSVKLLNKIRAGRERVLSATVGFLNPVYRIVMPRNKKWGFTKNDLKGFPEGTLGADLYLWYHNNEFDILPYLETHDVYHVLLGYQPTIIDESRMYFFLLGNGKRNLETLGTIWNALVLLPDYWSDLFSHYRKGKGAVYFGGWKFNEMLMEPTTVLRSQIFSPLL